jgi:hypothetical protein
MKDYFPFIRQSFNPGIVCDINYTTFKPAKLTSPLLLAGVLTQELIKWNAHNAADSEIIHVMKTSAKIYISIAEK